MRTQTKREDGPAKTEAEAGVSLPQTKDWSWECQKLEKARKTRLPAGSEGAGPGQPLDFRFLTYSTTRQWISGG